MWEISLHLDHLSSIHPEDTINVADTKLLTRAPIDYTNLKAWGYLVLTFNNVKEPYLHSW